MLGRTFRSAGTKRPWPQCLRRIPIAAAPGCVQWRGYSVAEAKDQTGGDGAQRGVAYHTGDWVQRDSPALVDASSQHANVLYDDPANVLSNPTEDAPAMQRNDHATGPRDLLSPSLRPNTVLAGRQRHFGQALPRIDFQNEGTHYLYSRLRTAASLGYIENAMATAEYLVKERREKPNLQLYNALILANVSHKDGAAWIVYELLDEMSAAGLQPDNGTCHAVLKVLSVHLDHLLRNDILAYMYTRWYDVSEDGWHDVVTALLRGGQFEMALDRLNRMRHEGLRIQPWLFDMANHMLCKAGEIDDALRFVQQRQLDGELDIPRSVWFTLLDAASNSFHHSATSFVWTQQVNTGYLSPSSGICLDVLTTAARHGDAVLATEVFSKLGSRSTTFQHIHYELLMSTYLATDPPDLKRALAVLTIMTASKLEPTQSDTRPLYLHLKDKPELMPEAFSDLEESLEQGRQIPIAVLNLLIECYVEQQNFPEALKIYKLIHIFVRSETGKSLANIETFNHLLRGCRLASPPAEQQALFLASELIALRVRPNSLTYDRLILVFLERSSYALDASTNTELHHDDGQRAQEAKNAADMLDYAYRYYEELWVVELLPRAGTIGSLAAGFARHGDRRCWDVLQRAEDHGEKVEGWRERREFARRGVERAWAAWEAWESGKQTQVEPSASDEEAEIKPAEEGE